MAKDNFQLNVKALNRNHLKKLFVSMLEGVTNVNIIIMMYQILENIPFLSVFKLTYPFHMLNTQYIFLQI